MLHLQKFSLMALLLLVASASKPPSSIAPDLVLKDLNILGLVNIDNNDKIIISQGNNSNTIKLTKINSGLDIVWSQNIKYKMHEKKRFPVHSRIIFNDSMLIWLNFSDKMRMTILNQKNGEIIQKSKRLLNLKKGGNNLQSYMLHDNKIFYATEDVASLKLISTADTNLFKIEETEFLFDDKLGDNVPLHIINAKDGVISTYSYLTNRKHSQISLSLSQWDTKGNVIQGKVVDLNLNHFSFAFNQSNSRSLFNIREVNGEYVLYGKLDYKFKSNYLNRSYNNGTVGFWVARFDSDLNLIYMNEYPFSKYQNIIANGIISKQCVMELKPDANNNTFIAFNVPGDVTEARSYIFYLDGYGIPIALQGGNFGSNFFNYDKYGVRHNVRKTKIRLIGDDWNYYTSYFLPEVNYRKKIHSNAVGIIKYLTRHRSGHKNNTAYTFSKGQHFDYVFEYTKKKELHIYMSPKSNFEF